MPPPPSHQTTHLLGCPPEARLLIINADDFGMCHAVNTAILQALQEGIASSTTLMVPCPWASHAIQLLAAHPELSFGVHLTLVRDFELYRWGPVTSKDKVPSLVDETGYFYQNDRIPDLLAGANLAEVEIEFRAQIETVLAADLAPTHLDFHCLADGGRPDIFDLTVTLAKEYGLALRVHDPAHRDRCQGEGLPVNDHPLLDSYRLETEGKAAHYARLLQSLPPGLTEWAVHPSLGNAEAQALEPEGWPIRRADFDFLLSPKARDMLKAEGIVLLNYRELQAVWRQTRAPDAPTQGR